ncbi:MAG: enoyl-CoA hydratase/isomerase family protein [Acidimicrobiales bacterium]|nr:enoyl-CoA hydratase/isomerase family protein [Acidimicrobiales bacterium]
MDFKGLVDRQTLPNPEVVATSVDGHIGLIEMNEPEVLNPLNINEMHIHFSLLEMHANPDVRVVILTGRGRSFCAGRDLRTHGSAPNAHDGVPWPMSYRLAYGYAFGGTLWRTLHDFPKPLIAAVNGYALGGGWELAHLCDWIIASESAVFGAVEIDVGVPPFASSCNYLAKMVGKHRAMDMIVKGTKITAAEALELGLVNTVVPGAQLMDEARTLAEDISSRPPMTVAAIKKLVNRAVDAMEDYELERALAYNIMRLDDTKAAGQAARARGPRPEFKGE